ncbi:winged helix-turn-helix transcriptional regulator [Alphaproteobacteria bacterium KMM 3653]|uniref:Winged helix-turn-helix transcriptional regulator n=1 Tax=Harenicola maris TaxID=2841044 RepID=A0AAP2CS81_9RHOB|nr:winged helix-turn-helix transcriptional regulator [Harenicola maris]
MPQNDPLQIQDFLPYLLNRAAEATSLDFQKAYKDRYGMLRTEWRVLFHLGRYGDLTAKQICTMADLHKTKVSRAVAALQDKRFLERTEVPADRRNELLALTKLGQSAFDHLHQEATRYNETLLASFSPADQEALQRCLKQMANIP